MTSWLFKAAQPAAAAAPTDVAVAADVVAVADALGSSNTQVMSVPWLHAKPKVAKTIRMQRRNININCKQ